MKRYLLPLLVAAGMLVLLVWNWQRSAEPSQPTVEPSAQTSEQRRSRTEFERIQRRPTEVAKDWIEPAVAAEVDASSGSADSKRSPPATAAVGEARARTDGPAASRPPWISGIGAYNVAFGKDVTSSDPNPIIGDLSLVTDGNATGEPGTFVELAPGPQWVQIDLEQEVRIHKILVTYYKLSPRTYQDVIVLASNGAAFDEPVILYNADHDNSFGYGIGTDSAYNPDAEGGSDAAAYIDGRGATARYVRLLSHGNSQDVYNHYCEVYVFAKERPSQAPSGN